MRKEKRSLAVVGSVVGLIIIIAAFGLQGTYATSTAETDLPKEVRDIAVLNIQVAANNGVVVRNSGKIDVRTGEVRMFVNELEVSCSWDIETIVPGDIAQCTLPISCSGNIVRIIADSQDSTRCF